MDKLYSITRGGFSLGALVPKHPPKLLQKKIFFFLIPKLTGKHTCASAETSLDVNKPNHWLTVSKSNFLLVVLNHQTWPWPNAWGLENFVVIICLIMKRTSPPTKEGLLLKYFRKRWVVLATITIIITWNVFSLKYNNQKQIFC